jgi:acyl-CoA thioester hydrolase
MRSAVIFHLASRFYPTHCGITPTQGCGADLVKATAMPLDAANTWIRLGERMDEMERVEVSALVVAYRDIGPTGEMRASAYVEHAEEAVRHFWRYRPPLENEPLYSTAKFEVRLHQPLRVEDAVRMIVQVDKIGGKSVGFEVAMEKDGQTVAEIDVTWTARDADSGEPVALPEDIRDWLYRYVP